LKKKDLLKEYQNTFTNYMDLFFRSRILTNASLIFFSGFPTNLPDIYKTEMVLFANQLEEISKSEYEKIYSEYMFKHEVFEEARKEYYPELLDVEPTTFTRNELISNLAHFYLSSLEKNPSFDKSDLDNLLRADFKYSILSSELILSFTYLDSFMNDSIKIIFRMKPQQMKSKNKTIDYEKLFSGLSLKKIKEEIMGKEIRKFSNEKLIDRINILKKMGVEISLSENIVDILYKSRDVRNLIVHNSGKIDATFKSKYKDDKYKLDETFHLTNVYLKEITDILIELIRQIYVSILKKFFKK